MAEKFLENRKLSLYIFLTIAWIMLIFSFAMQSGEDSSQTSGGIVSMIVDLLFPQGFTYIEQLTFFIRKLAHFTEYFILGVLVLQTLKQTKCPKQVMVSLVICMLVASCDETIQLFSDGRSGKVVDVLLDSVGSWCGIMGRLKVRC